MGEFVALMHAYQERISVSRYDYAYPEPYPDPEALTMAMSSGTREAS